MNTAPTHPQRRQWLRHASAHALALAAAPALALANTTAPATGSATPAWLAPLLPGAVSAGSGRLRYWGFEVYDAQLWVAPGFDATRYAEFPLALELAYLRTLYGQAIAERSIEEMRRAGPFTDAQARDWQARMTALFPDVKRGDRITGVHVPGVGARFFLNGQPRGELRDEAFSRLFFGIWLSPATSQPRLREALLQRFKAAA
jgi:hypothetical protein